MTYICSLSTDIIIDAANKQCKHQLKSLELHFNQSVTSIRQTLATNGNSAFKSDSVTLDGSLNDLMSNLVLTTIEKCKVVLKDLMVCSPYVNWKPLTEVLHF